MTCWGLFVKLSAGGARAQAGVVAALRMGTWGEVPLTTLLPNDPVCNAAGEVTFNSKIGRVLSYLATEGRKLLGWGLEACFFNQ